MMYVPMITVSHSITALKTVTIAKARSRFRRRLDRVRPRGVEVEQRRCQS
jgi:hypothetical protein